MSLDPKLTDSRNPCNHPTPTEPPRVTSEDLYLMMEDWDNVELDSYEQGEVWEEKIIEFNREHGTNFKPRNYVINYLSWKRDRYKPDM